MSKKILFIMFPGNGILKKGWDTIDYDEKKNKIKKNNFIKELKKLGSIYFYEPKYYNINHYYSKNGDKWYNNTDIDFNKDDLDINHVCNKIYNEIKDFDGKIVPIAHSMGSYFVYYFSNKYSSKILFSVIIDGMHIASYPGYNGLVNAKKYKQELKKYSKYSNQDILDLIQKIKNNQKKSIEEMSKVYFNHIVNYRNKLQKIKYKKPMLLFYNYEIEHDKIDQLANKRQIKEIDFVRKNNSRNMYEQIIFFDKTHFPFKIEDSKNIILENIKFMISIYVLKQNREP